jgi:hypothetical protein
MIALSLKKKKKEKCQQNIKTENATGINLTVDSPYRSKY